jgi:hypothetical protein
LLDHLGFTAAAALEFTVPPFLLARADDLDRVSLTDV